MKKCAVGNLGLTVGLRVVDGCKLLGNVQFVTPGLEGIVGKLFSIVTENDTGDTKVGDKVFPHEFEDIASRESGQGLDLNPFGKVVHGNDQKLKTAWGFGKRPTILMPYW